FAVTAAVLDHHPYPSACVYLSLCAFFRHHVLPFFPTRRSSDLFRGEIQHAVHYRTPEPFRGKHVVCVGFGKTDAHDVLTAERLRSEEHTSELQSRVDLVCRLLLEKKKRNDHARTNT